jgi:hypothetical protein
MMRAMLALYTATCNEGCHSLLSERNYFPPLSKPSVNGHREADLLTIPIDKRKRVALAFHTLTDGTNTYHASRHNQKATTFIKLSATGMVIRLTCQMMALILRTEGREKLRENRYIVVGDTSQLTRTGEFCNMYANLYCKLLKLPHSA